MAKKKAAAKQEPPKPEATAAAAGIQQRLKKPVIRKTFEPNDTERKVVEYMDQRITDMIDWRESLGIEKKWKEADEEYIPHELDFGTTRKRFETDQDTGLRSRMVPVGDVTQQWRSAASIWASRSWCRARASVVRSRRTVALVAPAFCLAAT
jgi:hypothetical protein